MGYRESKRGSNSLSASISLKALRSGSELCLLIDLQAFLHRAHEEWRRGSNMNSLAWKRHILHFYSQSNARWSRDSNLDAKEARKC